MKKLILFLTLILPISAFAQDDVDAIAPVLFQGANFFVCIVAGVLLAIAFQLMLTALSVAAGITAIGNLDEKDHSHHSHDHHHNHPDEGGMNIGEKISTGLGAWTMITTSIALFFASLLGVKLGLVGANFIGATLGLVIWAAFFIAMTYWEISAASSLIGGMLSTVKNSLSSTFSIFSKSDESKSKDIAKASAKEQARQMRKQLEKLFSTHDVDKKVDDYIRQLKPQKVDIHKIKKEIKDLLTDLQVTEKADYDYPNSVKKLILEEADKSTLSPEDKQAVKDHVNNLKDIARKDTSNEEKAKQGIEELTNADRQKIDHYQQQIKQALQNTNKEELQPERLEEDIRRILNHPGETSNILKAKASAIDHDTLVKLLASQQNMSEADTDKYVSKVESILQKISSSFSSTGSGISSKEGDIKSRIKNMFSGGSSFDLDTIYYDFNNIFRESADGTDLKYKLKHYNKAELTTFISTKTTLSWAESESIAEKIVSARDNVLSKVDEVEAKVNEEMHKAKEKGLAAAEETRKTAATAAWWLVATAILSAIASAVGGMLALEGWFF